MKKNLRIACAGPSGVGKTTLCKALSVEMGIPFLTTSTKPLWEKHGINNHQELITRAILNPQWGNDFQNEVLDYRANIILKNQHFITDRSPIDNLVYYLMQNTPYLGEEYTENYLQKCVNLSTELDGIIQIPFNHETVLENDGMRVANRYYQLSTNSQFAVAGNLIAELMPAKQAPIIKTLHMWDFQIRLQEGIHFISNLVESK